MTEAEWLQAADPWPMLEFLRWKVSDRKLRLFVTACCRRVWDGLRDVRSRTAVEVAEQFADGVSSEAELIAAHDAAGDAVDDCLGYSEFSEDQAVAAYLSAELVVEAGPDLFPDYVALHAIGYAFDGPPKEGEPKQAAILRDVFGNPFRTVSVDHSWLTSTVLALAAGAYQDRAFDRMPILADALQDAGCDSDELLNHLRSDGPHVRGCWALDLVLGKS